MATERDEALWLDSRQRVTLVELSECTGMPVPVLKELVEYGALAPAEAQSGEWTFVADCVVCVRAAARVGQDLELEVPMLALVLSYLDRIQQLESELRRLGAKAGEPHP